MVPDALESVRHRLAFTLGRLGGRRSFQPSCLALAWCFGRSSRRGIRDDPADDTDTAAHHVYADHGAEHWSFRYHTGQANSAGQAGSGKCVHQSCGRLYRFGLVLGWVDMSACYLCWICEVLPQVATYETLEDSGMAFVQEFMGLGSVPGKCIHRS